MKKIFLLIVVMLNWLLVSAQYNNEWIDYNKTYYKFPVGKDGLFRISQTVLQSIGLENTPAEHFQLWRNGAEVPIYTSTPSGPLGTGGFIEFYGRMNDGVPDTRLYRDINFQLSDKWSLETDTASYFLTVNPGSSNARMVDQVNDVAGSALTPDPYFMYTYRKSFKDRINHGFAGLVGEYVYSSSYDKGEGYTSREITPGNPLSETVNNLFLYSGGPDGTFYVAGSGNANNPRTLRAFVNNVQMVDAPMDSFNDQKQLTSLSNSTLSSASAVVRFVNTSANPNDRMVIAKYEFTYARQFNFGNTKNFEFELEANPAGNLLRISNFNRESSIPVLYDLTNQKRYLANTSEAGVIKFALLPSAQRRKLMLASQAAANITNVTAFSVVNFIDYSKPENQGDYIIISNKFLYSGPNGNPVEAYRQYRASAPGGGHNSKIFDIDQLTDQFAFGIKRHPFSIKNFLKYARSVFQLSPRAVFLIGKGVSYPQARQNESNPLLERMNLVPPFGYPASDNLLASIDNETISAIPIGRLSAVTPREIEVYLEKVKEYEAAAVNAPNTINGRAWMKNIVHAIGGGDPELAAQIGGYMNQMKRIIEDTAFGANVMSFSKTPSVASQLTSEGLKNMFADGIGIINYFGHSSASNIEFNIDDPYAYQNEGKYPLLLVNGCLAGDIFNFEPTRFSSVLTLSEKYVFAEKRGCISFIASSHFGIVNYLNTYLQGFYDEIAKDSYGLPTGKILENAFEYILSRWTGDYFARLHAEEITLHGDPMIKLYTRELPDFAIEDQSVKLPSTVTITENSLNLQVKYYNLGKAIKDSVTFEIKRILPDGSQKTILVRRVAGNRHSDSISVFIPINPAQEKGENRIVVTIDKDDQVAEISETNNTVIKTFQVIEDGVRPIYPYEFSIVNKTDFSFYASSVNPLVSVKNYLFEIDTTAAFNSSSKMSLSINSSSNIIEFKPSVSYIDSTVYYWRVAQVQNGGDSLQWSRSSFTYLRNTTEGYGQGHYFQHLQSGFDSVVLKNDRTFRFTQKEAVIRARIGLYPTYNWDRVDVSLEDSLIGQWLCADFNVLQFIVIDSKTGTAWRNFTTQGMGQFGSLATCHTPPYTYAFKMNDTSHRRRAMDFLEMIPDGHYVMIYWTGASRTSWTAANATFVSHWKNDELRLGANRSLYHSFIKNGLTEIDKFVKNVPFLFMFKKGDNTYPVFQRIGDNDEEHIVQNFTIDISFSHGTISSPWFGPVTNWQELYWSGSKFASTDSRLMIYGRSNDGVESHLTTIVNAKDTSLAFIDAKQYPYLRLALHSEDKEAVTPFQLRYWNLLGQLPPEGVIYPDVNFVMKDTVDIGELLDVRVLFKNVSSISFDSIKINVGVIDNNNNTRIISIPKGKALQSGDTLLLQYPLDTKQYPGTNTFFIYFNPDNDQPEQYTFNNFIYKTFYVRPDHLRPILDVTFDGVHILNNDIVSAKPHILAKIKDENKYLRLDDTSVVKVQIRYPNGTYRAFSFINDTLRFTPASANAMDDNTATIDFNPSFLEDGDYELIISARDKSGNASGTVDYSTSFKVINKPMITNVFNYPNPFTTSTAFVFTLTGSEVPQNLRIQILTITGKIVKEIAKQELGKIQIGRNITEYKWDGTDQFGNKLANGVYLYRVITNMNGRSLEKYNPEGNATDQYFNKGYGKMYLMR